MKVSDSAITPSTSDCAATWKVKNGVATKGKTSTSTSTNTWRASRWRHKYLSQRGALLSA